VLALDWITIMQGRSVRGVVMGSSDPSVFVPALVRMHAEGRLPLDRIVQTVPFEMINDAVGGTESGALVKPVLLF